MKKIANYWFIIVFALGLIVPIYGKVIDSRISLSGVSASPDKVEANIFNIGDGTYQSYLNELWEIYFPGKKFLLRVRNQLLYSVCKVSPNSNVVIGKEGYLYEPAYILFENQTYAPSSQEYFNKLGSDLNKLNNLLIENDKELYIFVTPSKAHFCKEYISDKYTFLDKEEKYDYTNYSKLIETLDVNDINYYDSVKFIEENKNILEAPLFYATGIHWSQPWGETCAANFLEYIGQNSKYDLDSVCVNESICDEPVFPATDLYSSLNLIKEADDDWWQSDMQVVFAGKDKPSIFLRGGSFMGQSLNALIRNGVFGEDVHFENNYYFKNNYTETHTISSFTAYDEMNLNELVGKSDILVLEVNEGAIHTMSWGFVDYLLEHPECLDYDITDSDNSSLVNWGLYSIQFKDAKVTDENPWGRTADLIDVDEFGKSVMLTPNTSFIVTNLEDTTSFDFRIQIHPWVKDKSDGAGIVVWYMDDDGNILEIQEKNVNPDDITNLFIDVSQHEGTSQIRIFGNNGYHNDDICDWIIFSITE